MSLRPPGEACRAGFDCGLTIVSDLHRKLAAVDEEQTMLGSETLWTICQQVWPGGVRRHQDAAPLLSRPAGLVAAPETDIGPALLTSSLLRQRAAMALRLARQIPGDPAAEALRALAAELECQAAAVEAIPIQPWEHCT
jgi:hypothetical protein